MRQCAAPPPLRSARRQHAEREASRQSAEVARLAGELERVSREASRLKEWGDVLKKVHADKLREEAEAHGRTRTAAEAAAMDCDKQQSLLRAELRAREVRKRGLTPRARQWLCP